MEIIGIIVALAVVAYFLVGPVIALFEASRAKRLVKKSGEHLAQLTARIFALEQAAVKSSALAARLDVVETRLERIERQIKGVPAGEAPPIPAEAPQPAPKPEPSQPARERTIPPPS